MKRVTESAAFVRKRIPSVWITTGPREEHGTIGDDPTAIVPEQLESAARLAYLVVRTHKKKPTTGEVGMVGKSGKATTPVGPEGGRVFVNGEHWQATSEEEIALGEEVEVVAAEGLKVTVKKAEKTA